MNMFYQKRPSAVALAALLLTAVLLNHFAPAWAASPDYEFQLVQTEIKTGDAAIIAVRLIDTQSGKTIPDAVIFAKRIDMAPEGMETMTAPIEPLPSTEPGIYRFQTKLMMAGSWRLSLAAKVQGETGTLENKLTLKVLP
jgi:hypothetical protein